MRESHFLRQGVQRRHYWLGSLALHACVFWGLAEWQGRAMTDVDAQWVQASTQAAHQHGMRKRVDSLKAMKDLADRIQRAQGLEAAADGDTAPDGAARSSEAPAGPGQAEERAGKPTAQQMLAQARALRDSIQKAAQQAQAQALAQALQIPQAEALARVQAQDRPKPQAPADAPGLPTDDEVALALERYEAEAREAVQRMQQQLERRQNGTPVAAAAAHPTQPHAAADDATSTAAAGQAGSGAAAGPGGGDTAAGGGAQAAAPGSGAGVGDGRRSEVRDLKPRRYDDPLKPLAVDPAKLRLGAGNAIGDGGVFANRVVVNQWYVIGPFHAAAPSSIDKVYPPELLVDLDAAYLGKGQRVLRWQYISSARYPLVPPTEAEQAMYYGYAEIRSDRARDVWMSFGADDDAKAWVNERLVWVSGNQAKFWYTQGGFRSLKSDIQLANLIEARRLVHLRQGRNTVLFKLYNNPLDVFFALVLEPVAGAP